ncbi:MAG: GNAT family N-acetyltransferase [Nitrospirae bacterium]|nr:GNAT family N-acetyltransferase [Nitrospirota bacterium]
MSFAVKIVSAEKELTDIYRLRYKVYCLEWGFEKPEDHLSGILTDSYDDKAIHFAARDPAQKIVGGVRLIIDSGEGFPIERYCELDINKDELPRDAIAEISRLVIHRDYRRRAEDKFIYGPDEERRSIGSFTYPTYQYAPINKSYSRRFEDRHKRQPAQRASTSNNERRVRHELIINLYKAIYQESKRRNINYWYAVMTKGIVLLLNKFGLKFEAIGDPVDYHGIRTPYLADIKKIEMGMSEEYPELLEEFIKGI